MVPASRSVGYRIRRATVGDLPVLVRHRRSMWQAMEAYTPRQLSAADVRYERWARQEFRRRRLAAWIAAGPDGSAAASGVLWLQPIQPRPATDRTMQPYLLSFFTEPDHRGHGLAGRLVAECVKWSRARGYPRVALHASEFGRPVYRRLGFARTWEMRLSLKPYLEGG